eukprot:CAMPEP_0115738444 /NCGR_PEP_ID=MMETSP0272-20121206/88391_1 /TAXON_ID=71861 /ORGANISM="Scrippsiella trochoidea, Strain CCMP3099" /LENGTH=46 /DNA_ID= /DNA_START= /DNA_END= /DNA_ORIENTATION=
MKTTPMGKKPFESVMPILDGPVAAMMRRSASGLDTGSTLNGSPWAG